MFILKCFYIYLIVKISINLKNDLQIIAFAAASQLSILQHFICLVAALQCRLETCIRKKNVFLI